MILFFYGLKTALRYNQNNKKAEENSSAFAPPVGLEPTTL